MFLTPSAPFLRFWGEQMNLKLLTLVLYVLNCCLYELFPFRTLHDFGFGTMTIIFEGEFCCVTNVVALPFHPRIGVLMWRRVIRPVRMLCHIAI
jgi:hypothetical protein